MNELKDCPCGKTPKKLIITNCGQGGKWAYVGGDCCEDWEIEFRTDYYDINGDKIKPLAVDAWNKAKRNSIPISKLEELIKDYLTLEDDGTVEDLQNLINKAKQ